MFIRNWKTELLTIPNLLSLMRLALIPVCVLLYLTAREPAHFHWAGLLIAGSCLTDALDGKIARKYHMETNLGKVLDPLADKLTQLALTVCLSLRYRQLRPVLVLFLAKELLQTLVGYRHLRRGKVLPGALPAGKLCTTVLFVSLTGLVVFPGLSPAAVDHIALADSGFLLFSLVSYLLAYYGTHPSVGDLPGG